MAKRRPRRKTLTVRAIEGGPFQRPIEPFEPSFRPPDHPKAAELRDRHGLLEVAGEGHDFDRARRLKTWVRRLWNHGYDTAPPTRDALDYITAAAAGKSFACGDYAAVFVQCCLAVGLPARQVAIKRADADFPYCCRGNSGHQIAEVYCRELSKWVVLDADANAFYTVNGVPVGALEIRCAWHADGGRHVRQVRDEPCFAKPSKCAGFTREEMEFMFRDFTRHETKHFYHFIYVGLVHGYSGGEGANLPNRRLSFAGVAPPPCALNFRDIPFDYAVQVTREELFNWPVDRTFLQGRMPGRRPSRRVELRLQHTMPFFDHFELAVGKSEFRRLKEDTAKLTLAEGRTNVRARCVDGFGKPGHEAFLKLEVKGLDA